MLNVKRAINTGGRMNTCASEHEATHVVRGMCYKKIIKIINIAQEILIQEAEDIYTLVLEAKEVQVTYNNIYEDRKWKKKI